MTAPDNDFAAALARAQAKMTNAVFNRINPHFKSKYADLASIREATLPALTEEGIALIQYTKVADDGTVLLITRLAFNGQHIEGDYPIAAGTPQQMGSALTYARRYCWSAMCGVATDDDDDANAAQGLAPPKGKTANKLRKEDAYPPEEAAIRACKTVEELKAYAIRAGTRTIDWPESWKEHLRDEYERKKTELELTVKGRQPGEPRTNASPYAAVTGDEIPDPDKFLDDLDGEMAGTTDIDLLNEVWAAAMERVALLSPPDQKAADKLYMKHRGRHGVK